MKKKIACGVKGWGDQMIVKQKSYVGVKKSFSRLGFFLHERGSVSVGIMKPRLDLMYSEVHYGSHWGAIPLGHFQTSYVCSFPGKTSYGSGYSAI